MFLRVIQHVPSSEEDEKHTQIQADEEEKSVAVSMWGKFSLE